MNNTKLKSYNLAKDNYSQYKVGTDYALSKLNEIPISIHCWQGDDLKGFENQTDSLYGGGILSTGNFPGRAKNIEELQSDIERAFSLIPGKKKLALHAIYGDFKNNNKIDRDKIKPEGFFAG